jgi:ribonuclease HIII
MERYRNIALSKLNSLIEVCVERGWLTGPVIRRQWSVECNIARGLDRAKAIVYFNAKGRLTITVQGSNKAFNAIVTSLLEGGEASFSAILPSDVESWIGVDESGKGDYFGPLVTAGVLVTPEVRSKLNGLTIRDSKSMNDDAIISAAASIRAICAEKYSVVTTMPERYNQLIDEPGFKGNSQNLLAWQHARAIENILETQEGVTHAICDQFGKEHVIENALMEQGRKITVVQETKAERDIAVAAASIIARDAFLQRIRRLEAHAGCRLPLGASDENAIMSAMQHITARSGNDGLRIYAKVHFKTTAKLMKRLGLGN